ncbi:cytochrome b/b6 domain-containing protein [Aliarcobacter butzleri]|uniref:cytochrome b/b6 domain-containing protein n=1 Tax=Aliarcobacter butzleri TaxID=28197 RepID=UPI003AF935A1
MEKSYIWSLPTRVFHSLFAVFILLAFLTDDDKLLNYHAVAGYAILILLAFRLFWGFFGPKYSKFKDFPRGKKNIKEFLNNIFEENQKYIGHNPLASYVMIAMLIVTFLVIVTGILAFGIQEGKGILAFLNDSYFKNMKLFKEIHEILANVLIALIVAHISGVMLDRFLHKKHQTLNSIVTGYKMTNESENIKLNIFQKIFALFMFILFIGFLVFNLIEPKNIFIASKFEPIDYKVQNEVFVSECGSCHTLYPTKSFT